MCKIIDLNWERRKREIDDMIANTPEEDIDGAMELIANQIAMIEMIEKMVEESLSQND